MFVNWNAENTEHRALPLPNRVGFQDWGEGNGERSGNELTRSA